MYRPAPEASKQIDRHMEALLSPLVERVLAFAARDPYFNLDGYMNRWWIQRPVQHGGKTAEATRIHEILRSDSDRHMHDHPWDCRSVVLAGGYWEVVPSNPAQPCDLDASECQWHWRGPGSVVDRKAGDRHYLVLPPGGRCLSWFEMGPKIRDWGYHVPGAPNDWVLWSEYESYVARHSVTVPARMPPPEGEVSPAPLAHSLRGLVAAIGAQSPQFMKLAHLLMPDLATPTANTAEDDVRSLLPDMLYKVRKNASKACAIMNPDGTGRRHDQLSVHWLIDRMEREVAELKEAVHEHDFDGAILECADVANFAAFIAGNLRRAHERHEGQPEATCGICFDEQDNSAQGSHRNTKTAVTPAVNQTGEPEPAPAPVSEAIKPGAVIFLGPMQMTVLTLDFERAGTFPDAVALVHCSQLPDGTHVNTPWGYVRTTTKSPNSLQHHGDQQ